VQRSAVKARVDEVKTEYSRDEVPLHPDLAHILLEWRERAPFRGDTDWVFGSPITGKPYYQEHIQKAHLREGREKERAWCGHRVAHVSSFVSVVVGRNGCAHEGAAGAHAARQHSVHDECVRTGDAAEQA
jgi:hypothetical protein